MTTMFGSAMLCRRAARFGVSPTMPCSCASPDPIKSPTTTNPVAIPTRVCSEAAVLSPATVAISSSPALAAGHGIRKVGKMFGLGTSTVQKLKNEMVVTRKPA